MIGVAVKKFFENSYKLECELKWANDILIRGKKVCGILSEAACDPDRIYYAICDIGINLNSDRNNFSDTINSIATSVKSETGCDVNRFLFIAELLNMLSSYFNSVGSKNMINAFMYEYRSLCDTLNKQVKVIDGNSCFEGIAEGISDDGSIVVSTADELKILSAADIINIRKNKSADFLHFYYPKLFAFLHNNKPTSRKIMLASQAANNGGKIPASPNDWANESIT